MAGFGCTRSAAEIFLRWIGPGRLMMRPARYYKPYSVTLQKFTHERYAGTEIPKNFASRITLIDPERCDESRCPYIYESSAALSW